MGEPIKRGPVAPSEKSVDFIEQGMKWLAEKGWFLWYEAAEGDIPAGWTFARANSRNASIEGRFDTILEALKYKLNMMFVDIQRQEQQAKDFQEKVNKDKADISEVLNAP